MLYKWFQDGLPVYLVRHYWWAYLWKVSVWFFDHQPIINLILFGQYKRLMRDTLERLEDAQPDNILQLTCVYGNLTPNILNSISPQYLHIADVASIQLQLAINKTESHHQFSSNNKLRLLPARMNTEYLGYQSNSFTTVIIFFLLHELPADARARTLTEALRVLAPGGRLIITEYGFKPSQHILYRLFISRYLLNNFEPFLDAFWSEDMNAILDRSAKNNGKLIKPVTSTKVFSGFYRVLDYKIESLN